MWFYTLILHLLVVGALNSIILIKPLSVVLSACPTLFLDLAFLNITFMSALKIVSLSFLKHVAPVAHK